MSILLPRTRTRRTFLRGALGGGAVSVGLPFLDAVLNTNGTALAATGERLPVRFGTWYWGMGHTPGHAIVEKTESGPGIGFLEETAALKPFEDYLNFFGGFSMPLDGRSNYVHYTGWVASRTGSAPAWIGDIPAPTLDLLVANSISRPARFDTLNVSSVGIARETYSARNTDSRGASEVSPVGLYRRLFGPEFVDPNLAAFAPDPKVMLEKSVLSAVAEQSKSYAATLGAADKARLDEYFSAVRQIETQLALQLEKPPPNQACRVPAAPPNAELGDPMRLARDMETVIGTHKVMSKLLAMAVACNQPKVFNMVFTDNFSTVRREGESYTHHLVTHEEIIDTKLGYQPITFWFNKQAGQGFATFLEALAEIREGDGNLLDNCLIFASTETNYARVHTIDGLPMWLAGKAGGRMKTGMHIVGGADPASRVGLTAMQLMNVPIESWGTKSLATAKPIADVMA